MNDFSFKAKDKISKYFHIGICKKDSIDEIRKLYLINTFNFIAMLFVFPLGLNALIHKLYPLALTLLLIAVILIFNYIFLKTSNHPQKKDVVAYIISFLFFSLMSYLIYTGGIDNTGPLWSYPLPMVVLFLLGFTRGLLLMFMFFILIGFILFGLDATTYTEEYKLRIIFSLALVTFLTSIYEYLRENSFERMHELSQRLEEASYTDPLTEIYNRRGIHKEIEFLCEHYKKEKNDFSVMICDIDYFKCINDTYGHLAGDKILKDVVDKMKQILRKNDIVGRWGGEEFIILLPRTTLKDAYRIGEQIRNFIEDTSFVYKNHTLSLTLSIGIAQSNDDLGIDDVIKKADEYMYIAKREGRNMTLPKVL